jgi:tetratricopeptide (TPR) repeat protein
LRFTLLLLILAPAFAQPQFSSVPAPAPAQVVNTGARQLDASPALFAVMVAINAAGYNADADSPTNSPVRREIRDFFVTQKMESLDELRRFLRDHRQKDPYADFSQYVSWGLSVDGPPDFKYRYETSALPPDVERLEGLKPLMIAFYREAHLAQMWKNAQPYYDLAIAQLHDPVANAVLQVNSYMRNATSGYLGRKFQIYVDLFGPPNQVQARSYVDDYFVVVTPSADPPAEAIRHSYLHYLTDPLPLKFSKAVEEKRALIDYAQGSPILDDNYKTDFISLTGECFIKAVESRIDGKPALVDQALREGFVLTPVLAEQLVAYEKQDSTMRLYFPDLIAGIDLKHEEERLAHIEFATERTGKKLRTVTKEVEAPPLTGVDKTLDDAEKAYFPGQGLPRDLARARELFMDALKQSDKNPVHAKAYYGLARITVLERDPETADHLFRKALELDPDPETKSWTLLYLGRLADSQQLHDEAVEHYKAALAVEGAPESVRKAAEQGLKQAFVKKN